ncbi:hypothetical protein [Ancylobacter sp. G4_0304]|uniref:hypothetical protein n=1 Tax=Ancylobacter sp. G4_0304 TaxID=3114289 RepID=UPI0039C6A9CD
MALLSELVSLCAEKKLDTAPTLTVFARRLREAGRLTQAGRGRGAAHMTFLDGARYLISCAATDHPERAVDTEFVFSNLIQKGGLVDEAFPLSGDNASTLDVALAKTLEALSDGTIDRIASERGKEQHPGLPGMAPAFVWLRLPRNGSAAELRVLGGSYHYYHPSLAALVESVNAANHEAQKVAQAALERETYRFVTGKNLTAELRGDLLRSVAELIGAPRKRGGRHEA